MTIQEKLAYYKKQVQTEIQAKEQVKTPTPKKVSVKEEKGL